MAVSSGAHDPRDIVQAGLRRGVRTTPLCRAIMGWLSETDTDPAVAEIRLAGDGRVWLRLSDEADGEPVCSFLEFLDQIRTIALALGMGEAQAAQLVGSARARLF